MKRFLPAWLSDTLPPDMRAEKQAYVARFIHDWWPAPVAIMVAAAILSALLNPAHPSDSFLFGLGGLAFFAVYWLNRRGNIQAASWLFVAVIWLAAVLAALTHSGILTSTYGFYLLALLSPFLLGIRSGLYILTATILTDLGLTLLQNETPLSDTFVTSPLGGWLLNSFGRVLMFGVVSYFTDLFSRTVYHHNCASKALRESEARFRNIVESVPVGIHLYQLEADGRLVFIGANPAADSILGIPNQQFVGKTIEEAFPGLVATEIPAVYRRIAETDGLWQTQQFTYEQGEIKGVYEVSVFQTEPGRMATTFLDITERKRAEEVLARSEERFRTLVEQSPAGIFLLNDQFQFIYANEALCRVLEAPVEKIVGVDFRTYLPDSEREKIADRYIRRLRGEQVPEHYDVDILTATGKLRRIEMSIALIRGFEGTQQTMGQGVDITDRVQAEQRRVELAVEKERVDLMRTFIGNITHDIKTPLTIIQTSLFLIENYTDSHKRLQKIEMIREQTNILSRLIRDLLMISQLDYLPELKRDSVDLNELVRETEKQLLAPIEKKRLDVQLHLSPDIPPLSADHEALNRAIVNLFENAVNYTPEERAITVSTERQGEHVVLIVADTGIGIDPVDIPHIFNRFYRSAKAREIMTSGSGLGLAIVQRVAEMHGGHVEVDSTPGEGTTFRLFLPLDA